MKILFASPLFAALATSTVLLSSQLPVTASQPEQPVTVQSVDHESYRVRVANAAGQRGRVQVVNLGSGQTLYDQTYSAAYGHRFNFRSLPAGQYALVVKLGREEYRYTVQVDTDQKAGLSTVYTVKVRVPKSNLIAASSEARRNAERGAN